MIALAACCIALSCLPTFAEVPLTTLRRETRDLLRAEAVLKDGPSKDAAATSLCDLYVVLRNDDRYATSEMLQGDAVKVRRRLLNILHHRKSQLKRQDVEKPSDLSSSVDSAISAALAKRSAEGRQRDLETPNPVTGTGAQGGGALPDSGWQLVELIQRVIAPDFWDSRGGPGTIRYFAMRRVLVVRATTDVHEQIRDLLMALR